VIHTHPRASPARTSYTGRARAIRRRGVRGGLDFSLLTLTGVSGTGRTRLALRVAGELVDQSPDGAWLVGLAALPSLAAGRARARTLSAAGCLSF
jgi:hypothetical protein